jgi:hypothetical protein
MALACVCMPFHGTHQHAAAASLQVSLRPEIKDGILTLVVPLLQAQHEGVLVHSRLEG